MTSRFPFPSNGPPSRGDRQRRGSSRRSARDSRDIGFTLIELLIVMLIAPLIIGTITLAFFASSKIEVKTNDQLSASGDAQAVSSTFTKDFQSAAFFTTDPSPTGPTPCGGGPQVVGMEWPLNALQTNLEVISYTLTNPNTTGSPSPLRRYSCTYDTTTGSLTPVGSELLSSNVVPNSAASITLTVSGKSCNLFAICSSGPVWTAGWVPTEGITALQMAANEKATQTSLVDASCSTSGLAYCFALSAVPRTWSSASSSLGPLSAVELLGNAVLNGCTAHPPNFYVNGTLVINSSGPAPTISGDMIYPKAVDYYQPSTGGNLAPIETPNPNAVIGPLPGNSTPIETSFPNSVTDPFTNLQAPTTTGTILTAPDKNTNGVAYANPGVYTNLDSGSQETLILRPGVYVVNGGTLDQSGGIITTFPTAGSSETPGGAMIYVTGGGSINLSGLDIGAPTSGYYAGIALWQDKTDTQPLSLGGSTATVIDGLLYAPKATISPNGTPLMALGNILTSSLSCSGGGNGNYYVDFTQPIRITTGLPNTATSSTPPVMLAASGGGSGNPVTFSIDPNSSVGACTSTGTNGATITFGVGTGTCLVDANQAYGFGNFNGTSTQMEYLDAPTVQLATQVGP